MSPSAAGYGRRSPAGMEQACYQAAPATYLLPFALYLATDFFNSVNSSHGSEHALSSAARREVCARSRYLATTLLPFAL